MRGIEAFPEEMREKSFELFFSTKGSSGFGLWVPAPMHVKKSRALEVKRIGRGTVLLLRSRALYIAVPVLLIHNKRE